MYASTSLIVQKADQLVRQCGTRDPHRLANELGVEILRYPFKAHIRSSCETALCS